MPRAPKDDPSSEPRPFDLVAVPIEEVETARGDRPVAVRRADLSSLRPFRRMRSDRIAGAAGVVALVLALLLVFTWVPPQPEQLAWPVRWAETGHEPVNATTFLFDPSQRLGAATGPSSEEFTFTINEPNVTRLEIFFSFQDDVGNPQPPHAGDTFNLTVEGPDGTDLVVWRHLTGNARSMLWENITIGLTTPPPISSAPVATEEEARAYVEANTEPSTLGMGTWRVLVQLIQALDAWSDGSSGDQCDPLREAADLCMYDPGNDFTLRVAYYTYSPTFEVA